jgi:DNA polymerase III sliding clamp (beta) subunit (PCNA family)
MNSLSQITIEADSKRKLFSITTENPNLGINTSNIDAVVKGDTAQMNFNYKYVADCFQSINSDSVTLSLAGSHKPMTIRGVGDNSFFYIVMPMNK